MSRESRRKSETNLYHVTARGNGKQVIFEDVQDHKVMLSYLKRSVEEYKVEILSWCLMSNHIHLLVLDKSANLSFAMKHMLGSYAAYFNSKYEHVGHVFQGRYASFPIENEEYMLNTVLYIHNNPEKAGICKTSVYRWSSYREYLSGEGICNTSFLLGVIGGKEHFREFSEGDDRALPLSLRGESSYSENEILQTAAFFLARENESGCLPEIKAMKPSARKRAIRRLVDAGLNAQQIEAITTISKSAIYRAIKQLE